MNREKQIEKMMKSVCMNCRYFMRCNDDAMCDGRTLSEILRERVVLLGSVQNLYTMQDTASRAMLHERFLRK